MKYCKALPTADNDFQNMRECGLVGVKHNVNIINEIEIDKQGVVNSHVKKVRSDIKYKKYLYSPKLGAYE